MKPPTNGHITVYFNMILHPITEQWIRVGNAFSSSQEAKKWIPCVRKRWRICKVRVSSCNLVYKDGLLTDKSKELLDKKYNMDA